MEKSEKENGTGGWTGRAFVIICPVFLLLSGSVLSRTELNHFLGMILEEKKAAAGTELLWEPENLWPIFPKYPTLSHYGRVLFYSPQFFAAFWNSVKLTGMILAGQLLAAAPAAWAFAVYQFRWSKQLFSCYVVLMLLPFQVTMLSQYLAMEGIGVMDTHWAVILPAVFSTFPVFLMYRGFREIPKALLEAARMDGAGEWKLFVHIGLPLASGKIQAAMVLGFLEYWGMLEQPLAFFRDRSLWPLSLYLPPVSAENAGPAFAAAVLTLIPAGFVFLLGQDQLEQGITASGLKA